MSDDTFTGADFAPSSSDAGAGGAVATADTSAQPGAATTAPAASAATTTPEGTTPTPAQEPGPIPFAVHKQTLENARREREALAQQWKEYDFVRQIPAADLRDFMQLVQMRQGDPVALLNHLASEIAQHPQHGQALRSFAAKQLAAARGGHAEAPPQPDLEVLDERGQVVSRTFSEQGIAKLIAHVQQQTIDAVRKEVAPMQQTHQQITQAQAAYVEQQQAQAWSADLGKDMNTWPGFHPEHNKEARAAVKARVSELVESLPPAKQRDATVLENVLHRAYREVVYPTLQASERQAVLRDLQQQANASTVNPSRTGTPRAKSVDDMSIAEALAFYDRQGTGAATA